HLRGPRRAGTDPLRRSFSPDGRSEVRFGGPDGAEVHGRTTGVAPGRVLAPGGPVSLALFSPVGRRILTAADAGARVWDAGTGQPCSPLLKTDKPIQRAGFRATGGRLVAIGSGGKARVWEVGTGRVLLGPLPAPTDLRGAPGLSRAQTISAYQWMFAFSPDGRRLAVPFVRQDSRQLTLPTNRAN